MDEDHESIQEEVARFRAFAKRLDDRTPGGNRLLASVLKDLWKSPQTLAQPRQPLHDLQAMAPAEVGGLNIFDKLSRWWEGRKVVRHSEFVGSLAKINQIIETDRKTAAAAKIAEILVRLDRLELYVGLKREPKPVEVPGTARIS